MSAYGKRWILIGIRNCVRIVTILTIGLILFTTSPVSIEQACINPALRKKTLGPSPDILRALYIDFSSPSTTKSSFSFSTFQMVIFASISQTRINLPLISWLSVLSLPLAGVWKDVLQRPVEVSQVFTICYVWIPKESRRCRKRKVRGSEACPADSY